MPQPVEWISVIGGPIKTKARRASRRRLARRGACLDRHARWPRAAAAPFNGKRELARLLGRLRGGTCVVRGDARSRQRCARRSKSSDCRSRRTSSQRIGVTREQSVLRDGTYIDNEEHEIFVVEREVDPSALTLQAERGR